MNKYGRLVWVILAVLIASIAVWFKMAAKPSAVAVASAPAQATVEAAIDQLIAKINTKIQSGAHEEAAFADELKSFDAIAAAYKNEPAETLANVQLAKAMVYAQVLENYEKAQTLLAEIKNKYPDTKVAQKAEAMLSELVPLIEMQKIQATLQPGVALPDFDLKDIAGEPLSIAKYKGKVVLVDFWATWCPPCLAELPHVIAAYQKYHDKGFEVIGISLDREENTVKSFIADKGMPWVQTLDKEGALLGKYGNMGIPATFLLDREGKIIAKQLRGPVLEAELEKIFGK